jgi:hypothetical protein
MPANKVNNKQTIKKPAPTYYHCFKLSDSSYAMFDIKMDMPIILGSSSIIQSTKLPTNSFVFDYELNSKDFFEKTPNLYMKMNDNAAGRHQKPPLRYHYINPNNTVYYVFKINTVLYSLFDIDFSMPLAYGDLSKTQAVLNNINKDSIIFYYKEDLVVKKAFKVWYIYENKKIRYITGR